MAFSGGILTQSWPARPCRCVHAGASERDSWRGTGAATEKEAHALIRTVELETPMSSMKSVTEQGNLADFISTAELAQNDFESQRANTVVIESTAFQQVCSTQKNCAGQLKTPLFLGASRGHCRAEICAEGALGVHESTETPQVDS